MQEVGQKDKETKNIDIKTSIIVCSCQRSGSSLFCEALGNTGYAGIPSEYFLELEEGDLARNNGIRTRQEYLNLVRASGTTPNGVFGIKLMWNYFGKTIDKLKEIEEFENQKPHAIMEDLFPNPRYVWVVRENRVAQAVSWAIAAQTGKYSSPQKAKSDKESRFDFEYIDNLYRLIEESEAGWQNYFQQARIEPITIVYEEFVRDYEGTALRTLNSLGINIPENIKFGKKDLKKQANRINEEWIEKYKQMKASGVK